MKFTRTGLHDHLQTDRTLDETRRFANVGAGSGVCC